MFWKRPSLIVGRHGLEPWTADAVQWLSDNGPQYTATATVLYAHELGLVPITTPAYSPESNGLAEAFVGTFKRDYLGDADLRDAETVLAQLGQWIEDYNSQVPHRRSGCGARASIARRRSRPRLAPRWRQRRRRICPRMRDRPGGRYQSTHSEERSSLSSAPPPAADPARHPGA